MCNSRNVKGIYSVATFLTFGRCYIISIVDQFSYISKIKVKITLFWTPLKPGITLNLAELVLLMCIEPYILFFFFRQSFPHKENVLNALYMCHQ